MDNCKQIYKHMHGLSPQYEERYHDNINGTKYSTIINKDSHDKWKQFYIYIFVHICDILN